MYKKTNFVQDEIHDFYMPFAGKIERSNRWVILADQIPWESIDQFYAKSFTSGYGNSAYNSRIAFGALIIKEKLGTSDRETVLQIAENPYLQYFLGLTEFSSKAPFDHSLMTTFRKRFTKEVIANINDEIFMANKEDQKEIDKTEDKNDDDVQPENKGKLLIDATCTPADIAFPTDLGLLNDAREKTEEIIDILHAPLVGEKKKPRTYCEKARKNYLAVAKKKRPGKKVIRKAIRKQLNYVGRNLGYIENLAKVSDLGLLSKRDLKNLMVIHELHRQQQIMHDTKTHSIKNRIVSISQPHVRPIVRGKAKAAVEFGAKVSASLIDGFVFLDRISWDNFNEGGDLSFQVEGYKRRCGFYPESVHADKIYITRDNRAYCKERGIRISGVPLGRPKKVTPQNEEEVRQQKKQLRRDEISRIPIEGKFGQGKRRFGLGLIMTKLAQTSEVSIMMSFLIMNLEKLLSSIFCAVFLSYAMVREIGRMLLAQHYASSKQMSHQNAA
jgi:IS5 family transposase